MVWACPFFFAEKRLFSAVSSGPWHAHLRFVTTPNNLQKAPQQSVQSYISPLYPVGLSSQWWQGCRGGVCTGSYNTVAQYTQRLRQAQGLPPRQRTPRRPRPAVVERKTPALTPRGATWLVLKRETHRDEDEKQQ